MTEPDKCAYERAKLRLSVAVDTRKLEIDLYWKRALFFWGFIAASAVAFFTAKDKFPSGALPVACFGLVCSFAWTLANRGSKYWQENWEQKVNRFEIDVTGPLFQQQEPVLSKGFWGARKFSVSKLTIALSDFAVLLWVVAVFNEVIVIVLPHHAKPEMSSCVALAFSLLSLGYMLVLFCCARTAPAAAAVRTLEIASDEPIRTLPEARSAEDVELR